MKRSTSLLVLLLWSLSLGSAFAADVVTCWFPPGKSMDQAKAVATALSKGTGIEVKPRIAVNYPEILDAFASKEMNLVYVGSFVQTIIMSRKLGTPLVQNVDGNELYAGIMIHKIGQDPQTILSASPAAIAYAIGATSGESTAKAATAGKAAVAVNSHAAAVDALVAGKAQAAVVKDGWWKSNQAKYPGYTSYSIPKVSEKKNPDNVLTASAAVPANLAEKLKAAAIKNSANFGPNAVMKPFAASNLNFSLGLMMQGKIDPLTYKW
ncbi:MAG: PhnD/SsuA/transferrin family substrate-binding protein [Desulfuromonadales bacterium]|nr:PhnD/SsuA/transferrin family substrate-binding protein [Desulfuromonadales bacterium]